MSNMENRRGGAPVGHIADLEGIEAASVIYLRLWCDGPVSQEQVWTDLAAGLGVAHGRKALQSFEELCRLCAQHGRRPLVRHAVSCGCVGSDESCFAHFIAAAAEGDREDAMLIATLLVRTDMAPLITALASDFGLALKRMCLSAPRDLVNRPPQGAMVH